MYDPSDSDTGHEWIEIYNNLSEVVNLTMWKFFEANTNHWINLFQGTDTLVSGALAVIANNASTFLGDHPNYNGSLFGSSFSLSNTGETLAMKNASLDIVESISYTSTTATNGTGKTLCQLAGVWWNCEATPGTSNIAANVTNATANATVNITDVRLSVYIENATVNQTYTSLFRIDIDNKMCTTLDNVTVSYNITPSSVTGSFTREVGCSAETGNWTPNATGNYTICGLVTSALNETNLTNNKACRSINVISTAVVTGDCNISASITADTIINSSQTLNYKIFLNDTVCSNQTVSIEYWIEDLFGSYAKEKFNTTQSFVCTKNVDRQWTPGSVEGSEAYKIIANMSVSCNDTLSDNINEKIIVVRGSKTSSSSQSSGSGSSGSGSSGTSTTTSVKTEIISYPDSIFIDDPFDVVVKVFNPSAKKSFSVYSYVYSGNTPVSQGLNGTTWSGAWTANKKELEIDANATATVVLRSRIENSTSPGAYNLRVKIKSDKEEEITKMVNVVEKPKLDVKNYNGTALVSTVCDSCEILIAGLGAEKTIKNSYSIEATGTFYVFLLKDSKILSQEKIVIEKSSATTTISGAGITGFATKKTVGINSLLLLQLLAKVVTKI